MRINIADTVILLNFFSLEFGKFKQIYVKVYYNLPLLELIVVFLRIFTRMWNICTEKFPGLKYLVPRKLFQ